MLNRLLLFAFLLFLFTSCEKDNNETDTTAPSADASQFLPLAVGNYWVYQRYTIDLQTGTETLVSDLDSIYIQRDTIIGADIFYVYTGTWFDIPFGRLLKHEGSKIVDLNGNVFFSSGFELDTISIQQNVPNAFIDSIYTLTYSLPYTYAVPAGVYTSNHQYDKIFFLNAQIPHNYLTRHEAEFYTIGVGITKFTTYFASSHMDAGMALLRYDVSN